MKNTQYILKSRREQKYRDNYNKILYDILKSDKYRKDLKQFDKLSYKNVGTYLALKSVQDINVLTNILNRSENGRMSASISKEILAYVGNNILQRTGYIKKSVSNHNKNVSKFEHIYLDYNNPFALKKNQLNREFSNSNVIDEELYAKTAHWSNRATKVLEELKEGLIILSAGKEASIDKYKERYKKVSDELNSKITSNDNSLSKEFLDGVLKYYSGNISLEEMKNTQWYNSVANIIRDNNKDGVRLKLNNVFGFVALENSISQLYNVKDTCISEFLISMAKNKDSKVHCSREYDSKIAGIQNSRVSMYNTRLNIAIDGYNRPFSFHAAGSVIDRMERKFNLNIQRGNIEVPKQQYDAVYKYDEEQKQQLRILKRGNASMGYEMRNNVNFANKMIGEEKEKNVR